MDKDDRKSILGVAIVIALLATYVLVDDYSTGENASDDILYKQLESNYLSEVEYEPKNREQLDKTFEELAQAFMGELGDWEQYGMKMSDNALAYFENINENYMYQVSNDKLQGVIDEYAEKGLTYRTPASISYSRDCVIMNVGAVGKDGMLKITLSEDESTIVDVVEYY